MECNPELLTTTTTTSATSAGGGITSKHPNSPNNTNNQTSGGHGHGNNINTTNIPGKKDPGRIHVFNPTTSLLTYHLTYFFTQLIVHVNRLLTF